MPAPVKVLEAHGRAREAIDALKRIVGGAISVWCEDRQYLYTGRTKTPISLSEKLESGRFRSWSTIDDLFACTIVVPTTSHVPDVVSYLRISFEEVELRSRETTKKPPDVFRFDATRFIGQIRDNPEAPLVPGALNLSFEVQILTAFEYAWVVATHDLVYKGDTVDWRHARLAAQLKAAVEQVEMIIAGFRTTATNIEESPHPETDAKVRLVDIFTSLMAENVISSDLAPDSWSRFADNVFNLVLSFSGRYEAPGRTIELAETAADRLRISAVASDLHSGSLFQLVVGLVGNGLLDSGHLEKFTLVDSPELRDLHGIITVPRPFDFEA